MDEQQKRQLESEICAVVQGMQRSHDGWVPLAEIGGALGSAGISYRTYGYEKLGLFWRNSRMSLRSMRCRSLEKHRCFL